MADPSGIRNAEQLARQMQLLLEQARIPPQEVARKARVSENTVRKMAKAAGAFPQQNTVEAVARACGQDPKPWVEAWHRASDAQPRGERTGGGKAAPAQLEELVEVVRQLAEQVAALTAVRDVEAEEQARRSLKMLGCSGPGSCGPGPVWWYAGRVGRGA
ncbi:helix-turn-helix domain-containing protein, partial [Streptomyces violascens]|uniref:helix-turn-helix domain-containing protein n=1 Tax=Streptomyces violascens TaxID=67381 RepID=UPI003660E6AC